MYVCIYIYINNINIYIICIYINIYIYTYIYTYISFILELLNELIKTIDIRKLGHA